MAKLQPVRGTRDIWGDDVKRFSYVVDCFRSVATRFSFQEIQTPIFEFTDVFKRTLGEASDVVSKEMYSFEDRGGEQLTLRPEYTAGIARAYQSEGMQQFGTLKFFGYGPMFRYERPQKGRYRQFHQIDVEILGAAEPTSDVEIIALAHRLLCDLGVMDNITLHLNSLGDADSRKNFREALVTYFSQHADKLSDDSKERLLKNPLRILDSKDEGDRALLPDAPKLGDYLNDESRAFFDKVKAGLDALGIPYVLDQNLVRGLDYYCHTAFEFITDTLGAQGTVIGGGRYDGLIEMMGGNPTPGIGFAGGIERLAMMVDNMPDAPRPVVLIPMGDEAEMKAMAIANDLRANGIVVDMGYRGNLKKRLKRANQQHARYAMILGEDELSRGVVTLRDLDEGEQKDVAFADLLAAIS